MIAGCHWEGTTGRVPLDAAERRFLLGVIGIHNYIRVRADVCLLWTLSLFARVRVHVNGAWCVGEQADSMVDPQNCLMEDRTVLYQTATQTMQMAMTMYEAARCLCFLPTQAMTEGSRNCNDGQLVRSTTHQQSVLL